MSDFIFARKTSNLILLCSAKVRKPTEHLQVTLNPLAIKGNIAEKAALYARGCVQIYGFDLLWLVTGCKKPTSVSAFGKIESKIRLFWRSLVASADLQEVFCGLHNLIFTQAKSQANSQTELSIYQ